jgi:hypothetical protein
MKLAKVTSAKLEIKERGILTFWVSVDYEEGCSQGVGGLVLDTWNESLKRRVGTEYGCEMIRQLLLFFGVDNLNEAKGRIVYVLGEGEGFNFKPHGFKHLHVDKEERLDYIDFHEILRQFGGK